MDLFSLECFVAVAELGSFTKAAQKVRRTQSAVTQQIHSLEEKLGTPLFLRGRKVALTEQGQSFLSQAHKMLRLQQEMLESFKNPELIGQVRLGIPEDFATAYLADILKDFSALHPRISLSVDCDLTMNLLQKFSHNTLDVVIAKTHTGEEIPGSVEIWKEPLVWVSKQEKYPLHTQTEPIPLILSAEPCVYRMRALAALEKERIPWRIVYTSPSYAGRIAAVEAHLGVTVVPQMMIPKSLHKASLSQLPALSDIHVCLLKQTAPTSALRESLCQFIIQKMSYETIRSSSRW